MSLPPDQADCNRVLDEIEGFVDGDLDTVTAESIQDHLTVCAGCRHEVALAYEIRDELRALPHMDAPAAVLDRVRAGAAQNQARGNRPRWLALKPSPIWGAAAALVLAAVLGPVFFANKPSEVATTAPTGVDVGAARLERATEEARVALAYVGQVSRRTGLEIRDDLLIEHVVKPTAESLSSLGEMRRKRSAGESNET